VCVCVYVCVVSKSKFERETVLFVSRLLRDSEYYSVHTVEVFCLTGVLFKK